VTKRTLSSVCRGAKLGTCALATSVAALVQAIAARDLSQQVRRDGFGGDPLALPDLGFGFGKRADDGLVVADLLTGVGVEAGEPEIAAAAVVTTLAIIGRAKSTVQNRGSKRLIQSLR